MKITYQVLKLSNKNNYRRILGDIRKIQGIENVSLNKEKLEKLIMDKKCVLLRNIRHYENGTNNYNYIKQNLIFLKNLP